MSSKQCPVGVCSFRLGQQQLQVVIGAHRLAEQEPLHVRAAQLLQECELRLFLDTFRDNVHIEVLSHLDDRVDDSRVVRVRDDFAHE